MAFKHNVFCIQVVTCYLLQEGKKVGMSPNVTGTVNVTFFFLKKKLTLEVRGSPWDFQLSFFQNYIYYFVVTQQEA